MTIYITVEQVDALLGPAWAPDGQKARAVLMANTWLTNLGLPAFDPVPDDVVQAALRSPGKPPRATSSRPRKPAC